MSGTTGTSGSHDTSIAGGASGEGDVSSVGESALDAAAEAEQHVARLLREAQARAVEHGAVPEPRKGSAKPRRPGSLRHIAAVITELRLYELAVSQPDGPDHNPIDQALKGKPSRVANVDLVLAIARACHHIAGQEFGDADARTYTEAVQRADTLRRRAEIAAKQRPSDQGDTAGTDSGTDAASTTDADSSPDAPASAEPRRPHLRRRTAIAALVAVAAASAGITLWASSAWDSDGKASGTADTPSAATQNLAPAAAPEPAPTVLSCQDGVADAGIIDAPATLFADNQATMVVPTLDFDTMNGSARYLSYQGRKYYWGRAGSDDNDPHAGGVRLLWKLDGETSWHECRKALPKEERDYVRTPAVPTVINNRAVTIRICLWRDDPYLENCTQGQ